MASADSTSGSESYLQRGGTATRGTVLLSAGQACVLISNGVINVVAARVLLKADYGRFANAMLVLAWTNALVAAIVLPGLRKIVSEDHARFPAALSFAGRWHVFVTFAAGVVLFLSARPLALAFGDLRLVPLFQVGAALVPLMGAARLGMSLLTALRCFGSSSLVRASYALCYPIAGCALLLAGYGTVGGVCGAVVAGLAAGALAVELLLRQRSKIEATPYPPMPRRVAYWASVSLPNALGLSVLMVLGMWLVKAMLPDADDAGIYSTAYFVSRVPMFMVIGLSAAVFSNVSRLLEKRRVDNARYVSAQAMRLLLVVFVLVCCATAVSATEMIVFLFSGKYAAAGPCLVVLVPAVFFAAQMQLASRLLGAAHRPGVRLIFTCCVLAVAVVCHVVLIHFFGIQGAAFASLATFAAGAVAGTVLIRRYLGALPPMWTALRCLAAGVLVYAVGWFWPAPGWLVLVKLTGLSALYVAALFALRELRWKDVLAALQRVGM